MFDFDLPEYDSFDIGRYDRRPLSLDEAIREADAMRKAEPDSVLKVMPVNASADGFYVESVDRETAEAEILAGLTAQWVRLLARSKLRGR